MLLTAVIAQPAADLVYAGIVAGRFVTECTTLLAVHLRPTPNVVARRSTANGDTRAMYLAAQLDAEDDPAALPTVRTELGRLH